MKVGTQVRAPCTTKSGKVVQRRAIVATVDSQNNTACIFWDDDVLLQFSRDGGNTKFLVTPNLPSRDNNAEINENGLDDIPISDLQSLQTNYAAENVDVTGENELKSFGDESYMLHSYEDAICHYESALHIAHKSAISIGGVVILKVGGHPVLADIDCMEGHTSIDITFCKDGQEQTMPVSKVLLGVSTTDKESSFVQAKILLNLARCHLQLADMEAGHDLSRSSAYRKASVLASSLALTCHDYYQHECEQNDTAVFTIKAKFIRARAYVDCGNFRHARADLRAVLKLDTNHRASLQLVREIDRKIALKKKADRTLAKQVCKWVEIVSSSSANTGAANDDGKSEMQGKDYEEHASLSAEENYGNMEKAPPAASSNGAHNNQDHQTSCAQNYGAIDDGAICSSLVSPYFIISCLLAVAFAIYFSLVLA